MDIQSLKDTLVFGIKGMAAYAYHAWLLGYHDEAVNRYFYKGLNTMLDEDLTVLLCLKVVLISKKTGQVFISDRGEAFRQNAMKECRQRRWNASPLNIMITLDKFHKIHKITEEYIIYKIYNIKF